VAEAGVTAAAAGERKAAIRTIVAQVVPITGTIAVVGAAQGGIEPPPQWRSGSAGVYARGLNGKIKSPSEPSPRTTTSIPASPRFRANREAFSTVSNSCATEALPLQTFSPA